MQELAGILIDHASRYPRMEPTDAVKLIYQNEFGGGHMIRDTEGCLAYLRREYALTSQDSALPIIEEIGNGIVRVHLAALPSDRLEELGQAFIRSANAHRGSLESFAEKLDVLCAICAEGVFSFDLPMLRAYLHMYEQAGYPAVSHSEAYRAAYNPAYRIVRKTEFAL